MTIEARLHNIYSKMTPLLPLTTQTLPQMRAVLPEVALDMVYLGWINPEDVTNAEVMLSAYWKHFKTSINREYNEEIL